jgi:glycosyltransferase
MLPSYAVITATLNAADYVGRAMESVRGQTIGPAEYVVIDGGSTDGTMEVVERQFELFRGSRPRIACRSMRQSRGDGIAGAWNEAIASLSSDVVFILNADDWFEPRAAELVLPAFAQTADLGIVHANSRFLTRDGVSLGICRPSWINRTGLQCRTVHCATFVRRSVYARIGGFDVRYRTSLDYDFLERCAAGGVRFRHVDAVVGNFQLGGASNREIARADWESLLIGLRHSSTKVPPVAAYMVRRCLRGVGLAGFHLRLVRERAGSVAGADVASTDLAAAKAGH